MPETMVREIADKADMIIKGYAFTRDDENDRESSMVITPEGVMVETNMDEIEQALVLDIWGRDSKYMEV